MPTVVADPRIRGLKRAESLALCEARRLQSLASPEARAYLSLARRLRRIRHRAARR